MAVADGRVCVDGRVEMRKRCKIRKGQVIAIDSMRIRVE